MLNQQVHAAQARQPEPGVLQGGTPLPLSPRDARDRRSDLRDYQPLNECVLADVTTRAEPEEVLIVDVRGTLTPAEMVERKLMALLGMPAVFNQGIIVQGDLPRGTRQRTPLFSTYARWQLES
jgi:hypothetical protein